MKVWTSVSLDFGHPSAPSPGAVHYRVVWGTSEYVGADDWSGWADDESVALRRVSELRKRAEDEARRLPDKAREVGR